MFLTVHKSTSWNESAVLTWRNMRALTQCTPKTKGEKKGTLTFSCAVAQNNNMSLFAFEKIQSSWPSAVLVTRLLRPQHVKTTVTKQPLWRVILHLRIPGTLLVECECVSLCACAHVDVVARDAGPVAVGAVEMLRQPGYPAVHPECESAGSVL